MVVIGFTFSSANYFDIGEQNCGHLDEREDRDNLRILISLFDSDGNTQRPFFLQVKL